MEGGRVTAASFGDKKGKKEKKEKVHETFEVAAAVESFKCTDCKQDAPVRALQMRRHPKGNRKISPWSHAECFLKNQRRIVQRKEIVGMERMEEEQKLAFEVLLENIKPAEFIAEYAKSGASVCRGCGHKIAEDLLRIAKADYCSEFAKKHGGSLLRWYHSDCFVSRRTELSFFKAGYMLSNFENLDKDDKKFLVEKLPAIRDPNEHQADSFFPEEDEDDLGDLLQSLDDLEEQFQKNDEDDELFLSLDVDKIVESAAKEKSAEKPVEEGTSEEKDAEKLAMEEKIRQLEAQLNALKGQKPEEKVDEEKQNQLSFGEVLLAGSNKTKKPVLMTKSKDPEKLSRFQQTQATVNKKFDESLRQDLLLSSDEEEEARYPMESRFNEFGKEIKRISRKKELEAQMSNFDIEKEDKLARMKSKLYVDEKKLKVTTRGNLVASGGVSLAKSLNVDNDLGSDGFVESKTKIRIVRPLIGTQQLNALLCDKKLYVLSSLKLHAPNGKGIDTEQDWVTMGVIVCKGLPKTSQKGSSYSILSLSDLSGDCSKVVSLFLFGKAHEKLWKLPVGTVVGVMNPTVMENRDQKHGVEACLSVNQAERVLEVGHSKDYGTCGSRKKDGTTCMMTVNKATCPTCVFHLRQEYSKAANKRPSLSSALGTIEPKKRLASTVSLGGNLYSVDPSAGGSDPKRRRLTMGGLAQAAVAKNINVSKVKHLTAAEKKAVEKLKSNDDEVKQLLTLPGAGSKQLLAHMTNTNSNVINVQRQKEERRAVSINPTDLLKMHAPSPSMKSSSGRMPDAERLAKLGGSDVASPRAGASGSTGGTGRMASVLASTPKLSSSSGDFEEAGGSCLLPKKSLSESKLRALKKLQEAKIAKVDPNAVLRKNSSKKKSEDDVKALAARAEAAAGGKSDENTSPNATQRIERKRGALAAALGITLTEEDSKRIREAKSLNADLQNQVVLAEEDDYFNKLAYKETLEEKMLQVREQECIAVICSKCKYRALGQSDLCKSLNHQVKRAPARKRWFECKNCKQRTITLDKIPNKPCRNCEACDWVRVAMFKERKGPKLASETLSIRGDEMSNLCSSGPVNLNLNV